MALSYKHRQILWIIEQEISITNYHTHYISFSQKLSWERREEMILTAFNSIEFGRSSLASVNTKGADAYLTRPTI